MVERQLPKLHTRVRFPSPAPASVRRQITDHHRCARRRFPLYRILGNLIDPDATRAPRIDRSEADILDLVQIFLSFDTINT